MRRNSTDNKTEKLEETPCPTCGHCPTCGRSATPATPQIIYVQVPSYQYQYPYYNPYWQYPLIPNAVGTGGCYSIQGLPDLLSNNISNESSISIGNG
jgi:hypothetical protein